MAVKILIGDVREKLKELPDESVHCVVTSPPYWNLRDYKVEGQIGLEATPDEFIRTMVEVFREVRRVLRSDGCAFVNMGDSYASGGKGGGGSYMAERQDAAWQGQSKANGWRSPPRGLKPKDLCMMPARLALALQEPYYTGRIKDIEDRIWLAAMIDAEGCMFIHCRKAGSSAHCEFRKRDGTDVEYRRTQNSYGVGLEVSNTSEAIIRRCMEITGQGSICSQGPEGNQRRKQKLYRWNMRTNECRNVIREIYPHLVAKKQQARIVLGCPSSGEKAAAAHSALIGLHNGIPSDVDFPEPDSMFEPGWYLRQDIIWKKDNPMPESIKDRCTKAHEYIFMLTKSARYYYDADAIAEPAIYAGLSGQDETGYKDAEAFNGKHKKSDKQRGHSRRHAGFNNRWDQMSVKEQCSGTRNKRSVWEIATAPFPQAHFATFPPELPEICIKAGSKPGDTILDPFGGAGTTGLVADRLQRNAILIELNPTYAAMAEKRIHGDSPMFAQVAAE